MRRMTQKETMQTFEFNELNDGGDLSKQENQQHFVRISFYAYI